MVLPADASRRKRTGVIDHQSKIEDDQRASNLEGRLTEEEHLPSVLLQTASVRVVAADAWRRAPRI
jgi:hypothetical protein